MRNKSVFSYLDGWIVLIYFLLVIFGWLNVYSSSYDFDHASIFAVDSRSFKQLMWFGISLFVALIVLLSNEYIYEDLAVPIYVGIVLLLILTIFVAPDIKGSRSWLAIGSFRLQPAEFSKFATALIVAKIASMQQFAITKIKFISLFGLAIGLPFLTILMQQETGSALVFVAFVLVLFRQGLSPKFMGAIFYMILYFILAIKYNDSMLAYTSIGSVMCAVCMFLVYLFHLYTGSSRKDGKVKCLRTVVFSFGLITGVAVIVSNYLILDVGKVMLCSLPLLGLYTVYMAYRLQIKKYFFASLFLLASVLYVFSVEYIFESVLQPHQQTRIKVSFGIEEDLRGAGYNVNQSIIAIGSGGLMGKGYLNGTQTKLKYVPEQDTDFIFCTVGEEWGFVGSTVVIVLYATLIILLVRASERQSRMFARIYGYCVLSVFLFHFLVNIGMVLGIVPVIGIPLPFFSYGGSSLLAFTILLFIFLKMDAERKLGG